jgi:hypothetical protein
MRETFSGRGDTHINEEASLLDTPCIFSLTCTVACSACFRTNQHNRAQRLPEQVRNNYDDFNKIINNKTNHWLSLIFYQNSVFFTRRNLFARVIYIYLYGVIALSVPNSNSILSFLCHSIRYLLDNVVYASSTAFRAIGIINREGRDAVVITTNTVCIRFQ